MKGFCAGGCGFRFYERCIRQKEDQLCFNCSLKNISEKNGNK